MKHHRCKDCGCYDCQCPAILMKRIEDGALELEQLAAELETFMPGSNAIERVRRALSSLRGEPS